MKKYVILKVECGPGRGAEWPMLGLRGIIHS